MKGIKKKKISEPISGGGGARRRELRAGGTLPHQWLMSVLKGKVNHTWHNLQQRIVVKKLLLGHSVDGSNII